MPQSDRRDAPFDPAHEWDGTGPGRDRPPLPREADETDYGHRTFVNLLATIFLLVIALAIVWTVQQMDAQEKLRRCLDTGQRHCIELEPPRPGVRVPGR